MSYLFEWQPDREAETLRRLLSGPHRAWPYFWGSLGVRHPAWFGINLPKRALLAEAGLASPRYEGDIDVLVGGGLPSGDGEWRPVVDEWAAIEAKVSWYGQADNPKATKEGRLPSARQQALDHLCLGATSATLLWIAVTEPVEIPGHHPWMAASARGSSALDAFRRLKGYKQLAERMDDPVGFTFLPLGAVPGGSTEEWSGAGAPQVVRPSQPNPHRSQASVIAARAAISRTLSAVFGDLRFPNLFAALVYVLCCAVCRQLFVTSGVPLPIACVKCRER